jgi:hypothetical protein
MKKLLLRTLFFLIPFLYSIYVSAQSKNERDCSTNCFTTEVLSAQKLSETCTSYELKVSFSGNCGYALSHFTVGMPCGKVESLWNSQNWKQVLGTDPTTGLTGFKIDDIPAFGETSLQTFTVKFNLCAVDESCKNKLSCWQPQVAYKASGCINYQALTVSCKTLKASLEKKDVSCFGAKDGSLSVLIEEGQEPYSYLWSNFSPENSEGQSITGLSAGTYSVVIEDASGSKITLQESIQQPDQILISGTKTDATCNGSTNGAIDLSVSGGAGGYSYAWSNGFETEDINSLRPGLYSVKVTDSKKCSANAAFTISRTSNINITRTVVHPDCNDSNGAIDITVSGGTSPYTFKWTNGSTTLATTEDLQAISAEVYTLTVTDDTGCSVKTSYSLTEKNTLNLSATLAPTSCTDDSGSIDLTVTGGTGPYTYLWQWSNTSATTEDLSNLPSGYYKAVVTDDKGCTATSGFVISTETFQVPAVIMHPLCDGDHNGSITLQNPVGGTGPFTYEWSNEEADTELTGLGAGVYSVTVTDETTGCSKIIPFTINDPLEMFASATVSNTECNGEGFFTVDLTVSGGTAPYSFIWSNNDTSEDIDGLNSGTYTVIIADDNGCTTSKEVIVEGPGAPWTCLITDLNAPPICSSVNNELSTPVLDADSYTWTIESTDSTWSASGENTPTILFTAGEGNSSATFTLTIVKDGCTKSCSYTVSACTGQGDGENTDDRDGDAGDQTCDECFNTAAELIEDAGSCRTYKMVVSTNGLCRHELSHWILAIPCGSVSNYSNSEGWKMVVGQDPTTGLYGLKVDDINAFGKDIEFFTVQFTLCDDNACDLAAWKNPGVAYKAGLCVGEESVQISQASSTFIGISVYPNPFEQTINFEWNAAHEDVRLEILDQYGNIVSSSFKITAKKGEGNYYISLESAALPKGMYYYRLTADRKTFNGKISKK